MSIRRQPRSHTIAQLLAFKGPIVNIPRPRPAETRAVIDYTTEERLRDGLESECVDAFLCDNCDIELFIDVFAGVITVLVDVVTEALTEVVIDALAGVVGVGMLIDVETIVVAAVSSDERLRTSS